MKHPAHGRARKRRAIIGPVLGSLALAGALVAVVSSARSQVPTPISISASSSATQLGLFVGDQEASSVEALGTTLGVTPTAITTYACINPPSCQGGVIGSPEEYPTWANGPLRFQVAVGDMTAAQATTFGTELVADGQAGADVRIMWEMNGTWYPWGAQALTPAQQIADFCTTDNAFLAVPGQHFTMTWNINAGTGGSAQFAAWPGASCHVDNIGFDHYDTNSGVSADTSIVDPVLAFAKAQSKPLEIDEWGLDGTDDPAFINYMASVVDAPANDVVLQSYFNYQGPGGKDADLTDMPNSAAAYSTDFGGVVTAPTSTTTSSSTTTSPTSTTDAPASTTTTTTRPHHRRPPTTTTTTTTTRPRVRVSVTLNPNGSVTGTWSQ